MVFVKIETGNNYGGKANTFYEHFIFPSEKVTYLQRNIINSLASEYALINSQNQEKGYYTEREIKEYYDGVVYSWEFITKEEYLRQTNK